MKKFGYYLYCFLFLIILSVKALPLLSQKIESPLISKLTTQQGLSSNYIYSVLQDHKGFIWIATEQGLNKFDGKNLTHFATGEGRYSLSHNRAQAMLVAPDKNIWIGTSDGLNIYDYPSDSIIQIRNNTIPLNLPYPDITVLSASVDNKITWIGSYGNGVFYFDWEQKKFDSLALPKLTNIDEPLKVMSLLEDENNRLWIGTQTNGLYRYDLKKKKLEHYEVPENSRFVRVIYQDSFRRIWVGTAAGCYVYKETTNSLQQILYPQKLAETSVGAICEDKNGKLWIGTSQFLMSFPVRLFSINEEFDYQIFGYGKSESSLNCASIDALFADERNNIWIGTAWGGVNMLKGVQSIFLLYKHNSDEENSLPDSPLNAICKGNEGHILIGTRGSRDIGLWKFDISTGSCTQLPINNTFPIFDIQSVLLDSEENLWIGTYNQGLIKTTISSSSHKQFLQNSLSPNSLRTNDVRALLESHDKKSIWIGTLRGLARYDKSKSEIYTINFGEDRNIDVRVITEDSSGTLWLGTYGLGVITYTPQDSTVNLNPIPGNRQEIISDIFYDKDKLWIVSQGNGVLYYDIKTKESRNFNEKEGIATNYMASVECDTEGNAWIGHFKGITKINPNTNEIINFNASDRLQSWEFSPKAALTLPSGEMVFAGVGGLNIFDPAKVYKDDRYPLINFTKLLISNQPVSPLENIDKRSALKVNITLARQIELQHDQSVFTIEFMSVNYNSNSKIKYAYLLEGADKSWNYIGHNNSVTFRNLSTGEYKFKVKASSPDGVWSDENIATLDIIVYPPFWATSWAYLIYITILLALSAFIGRLISVRIEAVNNLEIERARHEKDEELHQAKLQFYTNISHELRTPLTLIIGPLETMNAEETVNEKKTNLTLILHNTKRLLAMVNQLLDFRKTERGHMKLKVQYADIMGSVNEIVFSFEDLRKQKMIHLDVQSDESKIMAWYDNDIISKSLLNLLSNALKFTPKGGAISVSVAPFADAIGNRMLSISVVDNGIGIGEKEQPYIFERFYQGEGVNSTQQGTGIGLHLANNLIELHHGTIEFGSVPNVKTTFNMTIPIDKSAYLKDELIDETAFLPKQSPNTYKYLEIKNEKGDVDAEKKIRDKRKKILVVEDSTEIRNYIKSTLGEEYAVEEAENGLAALELARLHEFDLVISDLMMPVMDGIEMCKKMKASVETSHIPIIMLTAKSDIENKIEGLSLGAESYITKPFHPKHLTVRVTKLLELRELLKKRYSRKVMLGEICTKKSSDDSPEELFLQKSIDIVLREMMESEFNGDSLAAELNISRMGLHRKIKALTGQTTGEFIRNIRLKKAGELLCHDGKNISEVCYSVGFNSPSYFATCFLEVYKMTPSEYVRIQKK